jgi:hypothetical protein
MPLERSVLATLILIRRLIPSKTSVVILAYSYLVLVRQLLILKTLNN